MRPFMLPLAVGFSLAACGATPGALAEAAPAPRAMTVSGFGEASATPDLAVLSIGVQTEGATAAAALRDNGEKMRATIDKLKARGVAEKDMQTQTISANPKYDYETDRRRPRIIGFTASNTLSVKLRDLESAGSVIDDVVEDGANTLGGLQFGFADPEPIRNEARRAAVRNAREKAQLYAEAAGVSLGPVLSIQDTLSVSPRPQPYMDVRVAAAKAESTPIETGESTLSASITLVYEIR